MRHEIIIPKAIVGKSFDNALRYPKKTRGDFFNDVRRAFKEQVELVLEQQGIPVKPNSSLGSNNLLKNPDFFQIDPIRRFSGTNNDIPIEIDAKFCARYGHDDYSLGAINYITGGLPSLHPFMKIDKFSLGNIAILVDNQDYQVSLKTEEGVKLTGYTYDISTKKKKSYICLLGIHFTQELILNVFKDKDIQCCSHLIENLDEIRIKNSFFPSTFICRCCGSVLTCSCFEECLESSNHFLY